MVRPMQTQAYTDLVSEEEMDAVMSEEAGPAIIDFWSPTCGPCLGFAPHFEAVARELSESPVAFYKVNTAEAPTLAAAFSVRSVPTILFVHRGQILDAVVGTLPPDRLLAKGHWLRKKAENKGLFARLFGG